MGVLLVSSLSIAAIAAWQLVGSAPATVHLATRPGHGAPPADISAISGGANLLVVGTDTRTGQGGAYSSAQEIAASSGLGNNDVNILVHIAADHKSVAVVSIPRDLEIPIPACPTSHGTTPGSTQDMFNTALSRGGLACVALTVEQLTGLSIPYAAQVSFNGASALSTAVGGVTVCLATPVKDDNTNPPLHLAVGEQTLVGPEALSFVRSRHGVGDGSDLGRISNQQVFMSALARKIVNPATLGNPVTLYAIARAMVTNMTLSDTLANPTTLVKIGLAIKNVGLSHITFLQYPTTADPANPNRVIPDAGAASTLDTALRADKAVQLTGSPGRAAVLATPAATTTPTLSPSPRNSPPTPTASIPATKAATVALPSTVSGQTAAEQTCTKGTG